MSSGEETKELEIIFEKATDYRLIAATGAWGGVSPQGEVIFDLFVDKFDPPDSMTVRIPSDGPTEEKKIGGERHVRESQVGVILRPDIAMIIGRWLISKAEEAGISIQETEKKNAT